MSFEYSEEYKQRCKEVHEELTRSIAKQLGIPYEEYVKDMDLTVKEFREKYGLKKIELEIYLGSETSKLSKD